MGSNLKSVVDLQAKNFISLDSDNQKVKIDTLGLDEESIGVFKIIFRCLADQVLRVNVQFIEVAGPQTTIESERYPMKYSLRQED